MTIVASDISKLLEAGLKTIFFEAYQQAPTYYPQVATIIPSTKDKETYGWLGALPMMREWIDERLPRGLAAHDFTIENKNWELSISVDRNALDDDQYGQIKARITAMGEEAARHIDQLVFGLIGDGFSSLCYDGQSFFDADHPADSETGTQSNKGTAALSAPSYAQARAAMMNFKDDQGKIMGIVPDILLVPPALEETARQILNSDFYPAFGEGNPASGAANPWKGSAELIVSPHMNSATNWFLLCTKRAVKPVILQMRKEVSFSALEDNSERGFIRREFVYGADARYNVGLGMWQFAYGSQVTG
jgi:phage major head subunit gpT-like protein